MRGRSVCVLLLSVSAVLLADGCAGTYRGRRGKAQNRSFRRTGWYRVVSEKGDVVGYVEECVYGDDGRTARFVYDRRVRRIGLITPGGNVYRFRSDGTRVKVGLVPPGGAEGPLLGETGKLRLLKRGEEIRLPGSLKVGGHKAELE